MTETAQVAPIDATEKLIQHVFNDDFAFEIPAYQRPYAWEIEQVDQLLGDLLDAMDAPTAATGGVYFLGSIVLIKTRGEPASRVIDGQQRLTTLTILFSALRDLTSDIEVLLERDSYVKQRGSRDKGTEDRMRLLLREADQAFFRENVQDRGATGKLLSSAGLEGAQLRIAENTAHLRRRLGELDESRRDELMNFLLTRCYLVVVSVPTQETARRIFTVLNARGLDLTATDILKAQLLERVRSSATEKELAKRWEACENALGRDDFVTLFTHLRMIDEREKPREALETAFPKKVAAFKGDPGQFVSNMLEPCSDAFATLKDAREITRLYGERAGASVAALLRLDNTDWQPTALAYLVRFASNSEVGEHIPEFFARLERLSYQLFVTRADVNARIRRHAEALAAIAVADGPGSELSAMDLSAADKKAALDALDGPIYKKSRVCKPLLLRLDEVLSNGAATYGGDVTIEHVLPQNPANGSNWLKLYPDASVREDWTHRLGNLVLLNRRANAAAGAWEFEKKKAQYFERKDGRNPFPLTQEVLAEKEWSLETLRSRHGRLVRQLAEHWRLV